VSGKSVTNDSALERSYAALVSPRTARDLAAIKVTVHPGDIGSGVPEQGGGPLRGGLKLANRFDADIEDQAVPYDIRLTIGARDGWLACEVVTIRERPRGPAVTSMAVRNVPLGAYVQRIREELERYWGAGLLWKETGRTETTVSHGWPADPGEWEAFDIGQLRRAARAVTVTTGMAAAAYREALASPDPGQNKRPTAAAADKLGVSRGHLSRLLSRARREGMEGLGPQRAPRRKAGEKG
jgi:hypothetical protein